MEVDIGRCNLYKLREFKNFVKENYFNYMLRNDKVFKCNYIFMSIEIMLDYVFLDVYMYMLFSFYEIFVEGMFLSMFDYFFVLVVYNI